MTDDGRNDRGEPDQDEEWTADDHSALMSRYEKIAAEAQDKDGRSIVANFNLAGAIPRHEPNRRKFQSKDIYLRLENTIYGPITQDELAELLQSGDLTGFESASADLQHWTPLIYHPRMTLAGEIDPDATHDMLHRRSSLPQASRAPTKVDLEALAQLDDDADLPLPGAPLAAILIKPMKVSKRTGLPLPVHADLEQESIDDVRQRTEISPSQRTAGQRALAEIMRASNNDPRREPDAPSTPPASPLGAASEAPPAREPVQTERDEPVQTERDEPAQTERDEPAQTERDEPAQTQRDEPAQTERDEPDDDVIFEDILARTSGAHDAADDDVWRASPSRATTAPQSWEDPDQEALDPAEASPVPPHSAGRTRWAVALVVAVLVCVAFILAKRTTPREIEVAPQAPPEAASAGSGEGSGAGAGSGLGGAVAVDPAAEGSGRPSGSGP